MISDLLCLKQIAPICFPPGFSFRHRDPAADRWPRMTPDT